MEKYFNKQDYSPDVHSKNFWMESVTKATNLSVQNSFTDTWSLQVESATEATNQDQDHNI